MSVDVSQAMVKLRTKKRAGRSRFAFGLVPFFAVLAAWWFYPDGDSLLHMATPVKGLLLPKEDAHYSYAWMPDGSGRFFGWEWPGGPIVRTFDCKTGRELGTRKFLGTDLRGMSPDGKWLLYDLGENYGAGMRKAVSLDGMPSRF